MFKNTAAKFMVFAWDTTTGVAKTGDAANITCYVSKDYGSVTVLADTSATEMDATNGKGYYLFDAAQGETNGDCLMVSAKSSTANIAVIGAPAVIYTRPTTNWLAPATLNRTLVVDASGLADANCVKLGPTGSGTAQTARDVGASVLLSTGTGTGQLDFTSGVVKANLAQILGTALTETAGQIAAGFKQFFNIASPTSTMNTITTVTTTTTATTATNLTNLPSIPANWLTAAGIAASALNGKGDWNIGKTGYALSAAGVQAIWDALTSALTTVGSIGKLLVDNINATISSRSTLTQAQVTGGAYTVQSSSCVLGDARIANLDAAVSSRLASGSYTAPLDAAGTRSAVGLASANLDTQLSGINSKTTNLPATPAATGDAMTLTAAYDAAKTASTQTSVNAVKTQTDKLTFTVANQLDSNVLSVNGHGVTGDGHSGTEWGPA